jgi:hypothetical protein
MEKGTREGKGMEGKGIEGEGLWFWFSLAPLRLCAFAPLRLCAFAPLRLCVYFFAAFISSPRFISVRGLQTIDHAVNPILDEPLPKIDHQPESQVS